MKAPATPETNRQPTLRQPGGDCGTVGWILRQGSQFATKRKGGACGPFVSSGDPICLSLTPHAYPRDHPGIPTREPALLP